MARAGRVDEAARLVEPDELEDAEPLGDVAAALREAGEGAERDHDPAPRDEAAPDLGLEPRHRLDEGVGAEELRRRARPVGDDHHPGSGITELLDDGDQALGLPLVGPG